MSPDLILLGDDRMAEPDDLPPPGKSTVTVQRMLDLSGKVLLEKPGADGVMNYLRAMALGQTNALCSDKERNEQQEACLSRMSEFQRILTGDCILENVDVDPAVLTPFITDSGAQRIARFAETFAKNPSETTAEALRSVCEEEGLRVPSAEYVAAQMKVVP